MKRRYSHLGPVAEPKGLPLASAVHEALHRVHAEGVSWGSIAEACGVSRSTMHRAIKGGNTHVSTRRAIRLYLQIVEFEDKAMRGAA